MWSTGSRVRRLSSCGSQAYLPCGMWDLPGPGIEPVSPTLAGRFLSTGPPRKSNEHNIAWSVNSIKTETRDFSSPSALHIYTYVHFPGQAIGREKSTTKEEWEFAQGGQAVLIKNYFGSWRLLCHHCPWVAWGLGREIVETDKRKLL